MSNSLVISLISCLLISCDNSKNRHSDEFMQIQNELTDTLDKISSTADFNGFGVVIVSDKGVLYQNGLGYADVTTHEKYNENTLQNIASVSKTLIGIAVLKAQELGKLKLDDPINKYLPFKVYNPYNPAIPITIRHLVTHTSTITDTEDYLYRAWILHDTVNLAFNLNIDIGECKFSAPSAEIPMEDFLRNILEKDAIWYKEESFLRREPGEIFHYSNIGATLAALVIEKATGTPYYKFTGKYILDPLRMNASGWNINSVDISKHTKLYINKTTAYPFYECITYPDGGLITSTSDFSKYMAELLKGYLGKGTLLSRESYMEYFSGQLKADNFLDRKEGEYSDEYNMGITMGISSTGNYGHTGGDPGLFSIMFFSPVTKTGKYMIVNTDMDGNEAWEQHHKIWNLLDVYAVKLNN
jgi:CubicO group peptidase (beta-lactamase class C family)